MDPTAPIKDDLEALPDATTPEDRAIDWVVRLTSGSATDAERAEFERWRLASPENEAAVISARQLWVGVGGAVASRPAASSVGIKRARSRKMRLFALAASLLLGVALGFQFLNQWRFDYATHVGQQQVVALADGSEVTLNSGTALDVRFASDARGIRLARGEAYFNVTPDANRPFIVDAGETHVKVLGTAFSVWRDGGRVVVTVENGRVEVTGGRVNAQLTQDQRVVVDEAVSGTVESASAYTELAWRRGRLIIEDQPLSEVVHELERYYPGFLYVRNPAAGERRLNAVIDLHHIDTWLAALDESQPITIKRVGPLVVIE